MTVPVDDRGCGDSSVSPPTSSRTALEWRCRPEDAEDEAGVPRAPSIRTRDEPPSTFIPYTGRTVHPSPSITLFVGHLRLLQELSPLLCLRFLRPLIVVFVQYVFVHIHPIADDVLRNVLREPVCDRAAANIVWRDT